MRRNALTILITVAALLIGAPLAVAQKQKDPKIKDKNLEPGEQMERNLAVSQNVVVTLCISSGNVLVKGWDRSEVAVRATSARQLEILGGGSTPAQRVQIAVSNVPSVAQEGALVADCRAVSDIELSVPRGATVDIKNRVGDVTVSGVAEARVDNTNGDINIENVTRAVEASTLSGDVSLANSRGRIRLRAISGDVDAMNVSTVEASDDFTAHSTSGDIDLDNVAHARLSANTTSGMITFTGRLARRGAYELNAFSGDVLLNIPADSAFKIDAKAPHGSINTDFAIKSATEQDSANLPEGRRLTGTYGSGDWATITINSFSGSIHLRKR